MLLPGAPPPEDAVGSGRAGVAGEPGCRDLRAAGVQGEAYATHRPVALEQRDQVGLQLALGFRFHVSRLSVQFVPNHLQFRWDGIAQRFSTESATLSPRMR